MFTMKSIDIVRLNKLPFQLIVDYGFFFSTVTASFDIFIGNIPLIPIRQSSELLPGSQPLHDPGAPLVPPRRRTTTQLHLVEELSDVQESTHANPIVVVPRSSRTSELFSLETETQQSDRTRSESRKSNF